MIANFNIIKLLISWIAFKFVFGPMLTDQPNGKQEGKGDFFKVWLKITFPATAGEEIETAFSFWGKLGSINSHI